MTKIIPRLPMPFLTAKVKLLRKTKIQAAKNSIFFAYCIVYQGIRKMSGKKPLRRARGSPSSDSEYVYNRLQFKGHWSAGRFLQVRAIRALLVENDHSTRHVLSALLRNCNYEVEEAVCHLYLALLHDINEEPVYPRPFIFNFEQPSFTEENIKELIWRESVKLNPDPTH